MASKMSASAPLGLSNTPRVVRQIYQETEWESKCRKFGNYPEIEAKMPMLPGRKRAPFLDRFTAILGSRNPLAKPVDPKQHSVWLLDNTAFRVPGTKDQWKLEVVVAYFEKDSGDDTSEAVAKISEILGIAKDDRTRQKIASRLQPFLASVLPSHTVKLNIEGQQFKLTPGSTEGLSSDLIRFKTSTQTPTIIVPSLCNIGSETKPATYFADETGWAVISDIDDTIKRTMTGSALGALRSTLIDDPEPIEGMPELYSHIYQKLGHPPFWYLSASPYNLYKFLRTFILDMVQFPPGMLILRDASFLSLAGLLASITQGTQAYKVDRIRKIHKWFPKRTFICIGDSTQSDPEAYGQIYRENPGWVAAIFIRKVVGVSEVDMDSEEKNHPERFEKAFEGVPKEVWTVFEDPKELYDKVDALSNPSPKSELK